MTEATENTVQVLFFGFTRDMAGSSELAFPIEGSCSLLQLQQQVYDRFPSIEEHTESIRWAVNCDYAGPDTSVAAGAEVALIPPVAGGS